MTILTQTLPARQLRARRYGARRIPGGDPWRYDRPGPRGRAETVMHLLSAGLCPGFTVQELREAWSGASEDEREAIVTAVRSVSE